MLSRIHFRQLNLAYLDGIDPVPGFQYSVAYSLYRFGRVAGECRTPAQLKQDVVLPPVH